MLQRAKSIFHVVLVALAPLVYGCGQPSSATSDLATNAAPALPVYLGTTAQAGNYLLVVAAPAAASRVWLCPSGAPADCATSGNGGVALSRLRSNKPQLNLFARESGINLSAATRLQIVAQAAEAAAVVRVVEFQPKSPAGTLTAPAGAQIRPTPGVDVAFDYPNVLARANASSFVVRMVLQSGALRGKSQVKVSAQFHDLKSGQIAPIESTVRVDEQGVLDYQITNLQPETVYRLENIVVSDPQNMAATNKLKAQYYGITTGSTTLSQARRLFAMRAISEAYDWQHNNFDSAAKKYNLDAPGGWCDKFLSWAGDGITTLKYPKYSPPWYERNQAMGSSANLKELAATTSVIGDLLMQASHSFMILSIDAKGTVWTVEGNFNNRVMYNKRSYSPGWRHGHLKASMINVP